MNNITTADIKEYLRFKYSGLKRQYIFFEELPTFTGYGDRFFDFWVMDCFNSHNYKKTAFEIKISRNDFFKELKQPEKRRAAIGYSNEYYFITPKNLVKPEEVPIDCRLIEVYFNKYNVISARTKIKAPQHEPIRPNWSFIAVILRRYANHGK